MGAKFGHIVTDETKAKIRQSNLGKDHSAMKGNKYALGYRRTKEQRANLSLAKMGHIVTAETRAKISQAHMGIPMPLEHLEKLRQISIHRVCSLETRRKLSVAGRGRKDSEETRIKKSQVRIGMKFTEEHCVNVGKSKKLAWQNPEWRDKVVRLQRLGRVVHPNKAEIILFNILTLAYPKEWEFVGDGSLIIGGKNPDFVNINGRKELIELFGDYWHRGQDPQERINIFKHYGFNTLVIWESELKCPEKVLEKIVDFHR